MSRLEAIKDNELLFTQGYDDLTDDFLWLIQQAERVEELEEENEALAETRKLDAEDNVKLWEENQRYKQELEELLQASFFTMVEVNNMKLKLKHYKQVLEFYADEINHQNFIENGSSNIEHDRGRKARQVLAGGTDGN